MDLSVSHAAACLNLSVSVTTCAEYDLQIFKNQELGDTKSLHESLQQQKKASFITKVNIFFATKKGKYFSLPCTCNPLTMIF